MQELTLTKGPGIKVNLDSGEYKMRKPTIGEQRNLITRLKTDANDSIDILVELLEACGMPADVATSLENEQLELLVQTLIPAIKKKV